MELFNLRTWNTWIAVTLSYKKGLFSITKDAEYYLQAIKMINVATTNPNMTSVSGRASRIIMTPAVSGFSVSMAG
jgi:hypothetical protein